MTRILLPAFVLATFAAAGIGFGASRFLDNDAMKTLEADRDRAHDCRQSGTMLPPRPVEYRNTRILWRTKTEAQPTTDPRQAERIAVLSADLADAQRTIRDLENRLTPKRAPRLTVGYYLQNGSMAHPYNTADRCPAGTAVVYATIPSARNMMGARSGDPNVCYVRIARRRGM